VRACVAPSPGKLVRFVVDDGDHVDAGQAYAEVEVMKMYMPLTVTEAGTLRLILQPGSVLETGALIAILTLDDPSRVRHARPFDGQLPRMGPPQSEDGKASSVFRGTPRHTHRLASRTAAHAVPIVQRASARLSWSWPGTTGRTRCKKAASD
jgi:pyruvate/2-oxoglutarate dehydrogenase complex dihydrolipoamide acyltransferase (E2) component